MSRIRPSVRATGILGGHRFAVPPIPRPPITLGTTATGVVSGVFNGSEYVYTIPFTVAPGTNVLTLRLTGQDSGFQDLSLPKWNGVNMSIRGEGTNQDPVNDYRAWIIDFDNPQVGSYNITFITTSPATSGYVYRYVVTPLSGVDMTNPRTTLVSTSAVTMPTSNSSLLANSTGSGCVLDVIHTDQALTIGAGQTSQYTGVGSSAGYSGMSSEIASSFKTPMSWTHASGYTVYMAIGYNASATASLALSMAANVGTFSVAGKPATLNSNKRLTALAGNFAVSGKDATSRSGKALAGGSGDFALSGKSATLVATKRLIAAAGAFALAGQPAALTQARRLTASVGGFSVAGQPAALTTSKRLTSSVGAFTLAGQVARVARTTRSSVGAFTLTGQPATLIAGKKLTASAGALALSGQPATFRIDRRLTSSVGAFAISGKSAQLKADNRLQSQVGAFSLAGQAATLKVSRRMVSSVGAFTLTGQAAALSAGKSLPSAVGAFSLAGQSASLKVSRRLTSSVGAFAIAGQAAGLNPAKRMPSSVGSFTLSGQPAQFTVARRMAGSAGAYALAGQPATLRFGKFVAGSVGAFSLSGQPTGMRLQRLMASGAGAFALSGNPAALTKTKLIVASAGGFALAGSNANLVVGVSQIGKSQVGLFPSPTNSVGAIDSNTVRANDNITVQALNAHDSNASIHIQSGLLLTRPASSSEGATYFCTDTRDTYTYVGSAWVQSAWAHWYCSFSDYTDQVTAAANTPTKVTFNTTDMVQGFSLASSSRMTTAYAGSYNFQWSGQFTNTDSAEQDVEVWIRINGVDLVGSTGRVSVPKRHGTTDGHVLPGWNYYLPLVAGDYVELYWAASSTTVSLQHNAASAWAPSTASIIATMTRV